MIPLKYHLRNLRVRWVTTLMSVLSTGLVVWSSCILFGLVEGFEEGVVGGVGIFEVGVAVTEEEWNLRECGGEDAFGRDAGKSDAGSEQLRMQQQCVVGGGGAHGEADEVDAGGVDRL